MGAVCTGLQAGLQGSGEGGGGGNTNFPLFGPQCYSCGKTKQGKKNLWDEYPKGSDTYDMVKDWALTPEKPLQIRYTCNGFGESLETMTRPLHGATITEPTAFHLACTTLFPWSAPCALVSNAKHATEGRGKLVVFAEVSCLDIFVSIDGKVQDDGLVIKHKESYTDPCVEEKPPQGVWCTLVSGEWGRRGKDPNALHLPLVIKDDPTAACLNASHDYATDFNTAFCQMVARAGSGVHSYTLRLSPRGYVEDSEHGPTSFGVSTYPWKKMDEATKTYYKDLTKKTFSSDEDNSNLSATFELSVDSEILAMSTAAAQRPAPEPIDADDYKEIAECGMKMSGRCLKTAGDVLGEEVSGMPDHVILAPSKDYGNDVGYCAGGGAGSDSNKKNQYYFVHVYYLWKGSGDDGVMVRSTLEKYVTRDHQTLESPVWETASVHEGNKIKNAQIDIAKERDADRF